MTTPTLEALALAESLAASPTLRTLKALAQGMPIDCTEVEAIKDGVAAVLPDVLEALDARRITFTDADDKAMLHGLLLFAVQLLMEGQLGRYEARLKAH
ncbi:hypothetical protein [Thiorhodococcus minor]|uniref:Uncharacterized protein n=1 Tax=Thiorhodococcus minor TaxID=57489 RepID=A0A6M0K2Y2_9GAMM|nr:hypothetical protein [Thiorhodococcus minor]NEV64132.1 hypothetical protein [Thiorhodococcus minor]